MICSHLWEYAGGFLWVDCSETITDESNLNLRKVFATPTSCSTTEYTMNVPSVTKRNVPWTGAPFEGSNHARFFTCPAITSTAAFTSASVATSPPTTSARIQADSSPSAMLGRLREKFPAVPEAVTVCEGTERRNSIRESWSLFIFMLNCLSA